MGNSIKNMERLEFLERVSGFGKKKPLTQYEVIQQINQNVQKIVIENKNYFLKQSTLYRGIAGVALAKMYNGIGIQTPKSELVRSNEKGFVRSIQEDMTAMDGLEVLLANDNLDYLQIEKSMRGVDKWQIFYDIDLMFMFLKFMTNDCLEQLKNLYLIDELTTQIDRTLENFYLYKRPESEKYEGVIAIDLEELAIYQFRGAGKDDFENFLKQTYFTSTPQQTIDSDNYRKRVWEILNLAYDGVLSESNLLVIKNALGYDFPKELEKLCTIQKVSSKTKNEIVEPIKRLWEYNNQNLGKEFGK